MFFDLDPKIIALIGVMFIVAVTLILGSIKPKETHQYGTNDVLQKVVYGAMLTTMAIVVKSSFELLPLPDVVKRVEIFVVFIILAGILLGPLYGGLVGFVTDLVYMFTFGGTFGLFTLSHVVVGLLPGLMFIILKYNLKSAIATVTLSVSAYFAINTIALDVYGWIPAEVLTILPRLVRTLLVLPLQIYLVHLLVADRRFSNFSVYRDFYELHNFDY